MPKSIRTIETSTAPKVTPKTIEQRVEDARHSLLSIIALANLTDNSRFAPSSDDILAAISSEAVKARDELYELTELHSSVLGMPAPDADERAAIAGGAEVLL
jgi:hypothetical protein